MVLAHLEQIINTKLVEVERFRGNARQPRRRLSVR